MKIREYNKAISLRKKGFTYSEIQKSLHVSKGSLSRWLRALPYQPCAEVKMRRQLASVAAGQVLHKRKLERVQTIMDVASKGVLPIRREALHLLGIMAYWAEGSKTQDNQVAFTNTDPDLIRLVYRWWTDYCGVAPKRIRLHIRVHQDVERRKAESYWRSLTGIPNSQCYKTTIKLSGSLGRRKKKTRFGIATIKVCDTNLHYRIKGWINGLKLKLSRTRNL